MPKVWDTIFCEVHAGMQSKLLKDKFKACETYTSSVVHKMSRNSSCCHADKHTHAKVCVCTHLASCAHLENVPDPPAPQGTLIPPQHVIARLVGEQDRPPMHGGVAQQHSLLLIPQRSQQCSLGVLLQQDLFVTLNATDNHLSQMCQHCQLLCREGARL